MNLTSPLFTPRSFPSQADDILASERHEQARVEQERRSLHAQEASLEEELRAAQKKEEEEVSRSGQNALHRFKQHDLADLLKKANADTERAAADLSAAALAKADQAADLLVRAALAPDTLSRL